MKCYTIKTSGEMRKYLLPSDIDEILPPILRKRKHIATAYLDFQFFPGFNYNQFETGDGEGMYGYGLTMLAAKKTAHQKHVAKNAILVLFDHRKFYLDRVVGDKSRSVWIDHRYELVTTSSVHFKLREIGTRNVWGIDTKGKLVQNVV